MDNRTPSIFLQVEHYDQCVDFYSKVLHLSILSSDEKRTDLKFQQDHLLLQKKDPAAGAKETQPFILWINTNDPELGKKARGGSAYSTDWADFRDLKDPDGNRVRLCRFR